MTIAIFFEQIFFDNKKYSTIVKFSIIFGQHTTVLYLAKWILSTMKQILLRSNSSSTLAKILASLA